MTLTGEEKGQGGELPSRLIFDGGQRAALIVALVDPATGLGTSSSGNLPSGAVTAANSSGNVAAAAANSTIAAVAAKTNYITGFTVSGAGATAASVILVTVTGLLGGTLTFPLAIPAGATLPVLLQVTFPGPLQASAVNTAIVVNVPSFGAGNTNAASSVYGYTV